MSGIDPTAPRNSRNYFGVLWDRSTADSVYEHSGLSRTRQMGI